MRKPRAPRRSAVYACIHPRTLKHRISRLLGRRIVTVCKYGAYRESYLVSVRQGEHGEPILREHGFENLPALLAETPLEEIKIRCYVPAWLSTTGEREHFSIALSNLKAIRSTKTGQQRVLDMLDGKIARTIKKQGHALVIMNVVDEVPAATTER